VGRYQEGKTNLDFTEARDSEWQWHQLGHMQVCTSLQADNHASTPPLSFYRPDAKFLLPNQQCQSTKGSIAAIMLSKTYMTPCAEKNATILFANNFTKMLICFQNSFTKSLVVN